MSNIRTVVINETHQCQKLVEQAFAKADCYSIGVGDSLAELMPLLSQQRAELAVLFLRKVEPQHLSYLKVLVEEHQLPTILISPNMDIELQVQAVRADISVLLEDFQVERFRVQVALSIARYHEIKRLRSNIQDKQRRLDERKLVERAKGLLMARYGLEEGDAYSTMRRSAMNHGKKLVDIAQTTISQLDNPKPNAVI
ncbi:ANTAR domain protein [gamma proteobacterium HTCC5015]|nr:ANTAR domain protein [gamma proteobacterium HTCC5015]